MRVRLGIRERLMNATDLEPRRGESSTAWKLRVSEAIQAIVDDYVEDKVAKLNTVLDLTDFEATKNMDEKELRSMMEHLDSIGAKAIEAYASLGRELRRQSRRTANVI